MWSKCSPETLIDLASHIDWKYSSPNLTVHEMWEEFFNKIQQIEEHVPIKGVGGGLPKNFLKFFLLCFLLEYHSRHPMFFTELKISNRSLQKVVLKIQIRILIHGM